VGILLILDVPLILNVLGLVLFVILEMENVNNRFRIVELRLVLVRVRDVGVCLVEVVRIRNCAEKHVWIIMIVMESVRFVEIILVFLEVHAVTGAAAKKTVTPTNALAASATPASQTVARHAGKANAHQPAVVPPTSALKTVYVAGTATPISTVEPGGYVTPVILHIIFV